MPSGSRSALLFLILLPCWINAQHVVQGRVVDDASLEPLAFVHVLAEGEREGGTTDIDGRFSLKVSSEQVLLRFSYVGYAPIEMNVEAGSPTLIRMKRSTVQLRTVEILPGENPAHRIIERVYANRKTNDGLRNRSHRYTSYSKTIFTAAIDSVILNDPQRLAELDSSDLGMIDWMERQHLLLIESATAKSFIPPSAEKEEVLAMRVSGLNDPSLLAMAASTKTFSIYQPHIILDERTYLSPIGPGSTDRYLFILQDTLYQGADSVFVISFQPRRGKKFDGLKGALYVNSDGFALQNVIAEPVERQGGVSVKLQQQFEKVNGTTWFPVQLNTFLYLEFVSVNGWKLIGIGRTFLKDIEVDVDVSRKEVRGTELVMKKEALRKNEEIWQGLRNAPLDQRELSTYHVMDSIGEEHKLDQKLKLLGVLTTGRLPLGPVDLRLDKLFHYNGYEGIRAGVGLATNDKITKYASLGGYVAYGFYDHEVKYGTDLTLKPRPGRDLQLRGYYENDVAESGGVAYPQQRPAFNSEWYRWWFVDRMDQIERMGGELAFRVNSSLKMWLGTERAVRQNVIGYQYEEQLADDIALLTDHFTTGGFNVGFRFAFREQIARLPDREVAVRSRWPVLQVQAFKAVPGLWNGEEDLWRVHLMIDKTFRLRMLGDLSVRTVAGMAEIGSPYPFLFDLRGTFDRRTPVAVENTFEVMRPNEFLADRYVGLHLRHNFGHLLFKGKKWRPIPIIVFNAAWGALEEPWRHHGYSFSSLGRGYYEAGLQLNNIVRTGMSGLGVGVFMRFGEHKINNEWDDLALKFTFTLGR